MSLPEATRLFGSIHGAPLFSAPECREIRVMARELPGWSRSQVRVGERRVVAGVRTSETVRFENLDCAVLRGSGLLPYLERLRDFSLATDKRCFGLGSCSVQEAQLVRYQPGEAFWWHCDAVDRSFRKVSSLCYLSGSSASELEGGETVFAPRALQPLLERRRIRHLLRRLGLGEMIPVAWAQAPEEGQALVFPSRRVHRARAVEKGEKYVIAMFFV